MDIKELAEMGYNAFCVSLSGSEAVGNKYPRFRNTKKSTQVAWEAAAEAIQKERARARTEEVTPSVQVSSQGFIRIAEDDNED